MFFEILFALLLGCVAGTITGLVPGIHINLVSVFLVSISGYFLGFTGPLVLSVFIISMSVVHTFLDSIPAIFLGAPDSDMVMGVLPGHQLLLKGRGFEAVKLTVIGSFFSLIIVIIILPFIPSFVQKAYNLLRPFIGYILILVVVFMIIKENNLVQKWWGSYIFALSGIMGIFVLNMPNMKQPLFPLLSGIFGVSSLIISMIQKVKIPNQSFDEKIHVSFSKKVRVLVAAVFSGSLTGIFPGLGAAQASIIGMEVVGNIGNYAFLILIGGINTVNFVFSLATFYTLKKARNGAIVAVMEIIGDIKMNELLLFLCVALIAGSIAVFLAMGLTRIFSKFVRIVNYNGLCTAIISFIVLLSFIFDGFVGVFVLGVATFLGMLAPLLNVKRSHAMGVLLLPVILYFIV